jgi:hypothetical protein
MPRYIFQTLHAESDEPLDTARDAPDDDAAKEIARQMLVTAASIGLPSSHGDMIAVEVFDSKREPLVEVRLVYEEIAKASI